MIDYPKKKACSMRELVNDFLSEILRVSFSQNIYLDDFDKFMKYEL